MKTLKSKFLVATVLFASHSGIANAQYSDHSKSPIILAPGASLDIVGDGVVAALHPMRITKGVFTMPAPATVVIGFHEYTTDNEGNVIGELDLRTKQYRKVSNGTPPVAQPGETVVVNGSSYLAKPPSKELKFALFPYTAFSFGGSIYNPSTGAVNAGTDTATGFIGGIDVLTRKPDASTFEVGGWYFHQYNDNLFGDPQNGNQYEVHFRYVGPNKIGFQAGYLNDDHNRSLATDGFILFDFDGRTSESADSRAWAIRLGLGIYNNLSNSYQNPSAQGGSAIIHRSSVNPSAYWEGAYQLDKKTSILLSTWYIRNRNQDTTRFALGFGFKF